MFSIGKYVASLLVAMALLAPIGTAGAQSASGKLTPPVIAVLDMRVIMRESTVGKAWQSYYNSRVKDHKDQIAAQEKALRPAWEELQRQRTILAPDAFQKREREFREKEASANRKIATAEQQMGVSLRNTFQEFQEVVFDKLRPIRDRIVAEKGIDMIFLYSPDLNYVKQPYDITEEVLAGLNKALPKIDIPALARKAKQK